MFNYPACSKKLFPAKVIQNYFVQTLMFLQFMSVGDEINLNCCVFFPLALQCVIFLDPPHEKDVFQVESLTNHTLFSFEVALDKLNQSSTLFKYATKKAEIIIASLTT